jgi:Protein of unknown function (DUF3810)
MKNRAKIVLALSIFPQILVVKWIGYYPEYVEKYYSNGFYMYSSKALRCVFGWIPFSVGDIFYTMAGILSLRFLILKSQLIFKKPLLFFREMLITLSLVYCAFHVFWGMNYYRQPLHKSLGIAEEYTIEELIEFTESLIVKANKIHFSITKNDTLPVKIPYTRKTIFNMTPEGFRQLSKKIPNLSYTPASIKTSWYSTALTYMGYSGYLNPFTNEAHVNRLLPNFKFPTVSCHEEAHQLGYSAENEANFIGYLATIYNKDLYFKYSGYTYALSYCLKELEQRNMEKYNELYAKTNKGIIKNYKEVALFWSNYENNVEFIFKDAFNAFLKINNQAEGLKSYRHIVALLVNFHKINPNKC